MKQRTQKCILSSLSLFLVGAEVLVTDEAHTRTSAITEGSPWRRHKSAPTSANERRETMAWREQGWERWKQLAWRVDGDEAGADK